MARPVWAVAKQVSPDKGPAVCGRSRDGRFQFFALGRAVVSGGVGVVALYSERGVAELFLVLVSVAAIYCAHWMAKFTLWNFRIQAVTCAGTYLPSHFFYF